MSNHVHLIASATEPNKLSDILRDLKKFTSTNIIKAISENNKESRKSCLPELQAGMLWIFKDAGEKNNRNKLLSPVEGPEVRLMSKIMFIRRELIIMRTERVDRN